MLVGKSNSGNAEFNLSDLTNGECAIFKGGAGGDDVIDQKQMPVLQLLFIICLENVFHVFMSDESGLAGLSIGINSSC